MKTIKTSELTGVALDWVVAKCEGIEVDHLKTSDGLLNCLCFKSYIEARKWGDSQYRPSRSWAQGGPITHAKKISIHYCRDLRDNREYVHAEKDTHSWHGYSEGHAEPLIAAMRCYVASEMGDTVEVPDEL